MGWRVYILDTCLRDVFGWLPTFTAARASVAQISGEMEAMSMDIEFDWAIETVLLAGWEGEFREDIRIFTLPTRSEFRFGYIWTHQRDGYNSDRQTIVVSPIDLPWLGQPNSVLE